jgi:hypothetical protein
MRICQPPIRGHIGLLDIFHVPETIHRHSHAALPLAGWLIK